MVTMTRRIGVLSGAAVLALLAGCRRQERPCRAPSETTLTIRGDSNLPIKALRARVTAEFLCRKEGVIDSTRVQIVIRQPRSAGR